MKPHRTFIVLRDVFFVLAKLANSIGREFELKPASMKTASGTGNTLWFRGRDYCLEVVLSVLLDPHPILSRI